MAVADISTAKKRLIALLNANPGTWSASVSGTVGAFPDGAEILQALLEADNNVACQGYANSRNDSLTAAFQTTTAPGISGDALPFHHGALSKVQLASSTQTFTAGASNVLTTGSAHGWSTGQLVSGITTGALPTGLAVLTNYYVIVITTTTIKLATSYTNAQAGTAVSVTNATGSGTNTLIAWQIGVEAQNLDDITNAINSMTAYVGGTTPYAFLYKAADGNLFTPATYWRVSHFLYTSNATTLQCNENETSLIIFMAAAILCKNASPALFADYSALAQAGIQQLVMDGAYTTPPHLDN